MEKKKLYFYVSSMYIPNAVYAFKIKYKAYSWTEGTQSSKYSSCPPHFLEFPHSMISSLHNGVFSLKCCQESLVRLLFPRSLLLNWDLLFHEVIFSSCEQLLCILWHLSPSLTTHIFSFSGRTTYEYWGISHILLKTVPLWVCAV